MRALILSDIHSNLEALTAVLGAAGEWDALWNLGDMVGYGGSPNEVLELMRARATVTVRGNHDRVCCGLSTSMHFNPSAQAAAQWTHDVLTAENLEWLRVLPQGPLRVDVPREHGVGAMAASAQADGRNDAAEGDEVAQVTLAHGSPLDEDHYIMNMRDAWAPLQQMATAISFFGHTHVQGGFSQREHEWHEIRPRLPGKNTQWTLAIEPGTRHLINPGSVGQPRDYDWRAGYAIYDSEAGEVSYRRVAYDVRAAQSRILKAGLPERLAARLKEGR
jgi:predicted phosphodiesterase